MYAPDTWTPLPDPVAQPEFYDGVPTKRLLAWVVDVAIILVATVLVLPFTAFTGLFFFAPLMMVVSFFYRWATLATGSATWGMRLMSIEIRQADGSRLGAAMALMHTTGYALSVAFFLAQCASMVLMLSTERKQGLTDHALGTVALNRAG